MYRSLPALVALLILLSGCSGLVPSGDASPEPTLTPAPVPEDGPTRTPETPERLAPGLTTAGVDNATALAAAHEARLNGTYVRYRNVTVRNRNVNVVARSELVIHDTGTRERLSETPLFEGPRVEYYRVNGTAWRRTVENGTVTYDRALVEPQFDGSVLSFTQLLQQTDAAVISRATTAEQDRYLLVARNVSARTVFTPEEIRSISDVTLAAEVLSGPDGTHVRTFVVNYRGEYERQPVSVQQRVVLPRLDNVSVTEPDWLPEARNRTSDSG